MEMVVLPMQYILYDNERSVKRDLSRRTDGTATRLAHPRVAYSVVPSQYHRLAGRACSWRRTDARCISCLSALLRAVTQNCLK